MNQTQIQTVANDSGLAPNPLLAIVIPTFNRAEFLDNCLEYHISLVRDHRIQIQVFDNASTDNTREVTQKWQKEYPLISYHCSEVNRGPDANFERALKATTTQYVWLLGDTYQIHEQAIKYFFDKLAASQQLYDMFIYNVENHVKDIESQDFRDKDKVLSGLFPLVTWMPALVYSSKLIQDARFERYRDTSFIQTGIILEYIADREFLFHWCRDLSVKMIASVNGRQKDYWADDRYFEIWINRRTNFVMSLPPSYSTKDKLDTIRRSSGLGIKELIRIRSLNIYTPAVHKTYAHLMSLNYQCPRIVAAIILWTPRVLLSAFYRSYLFFKNLYFKRRATPPAYLDGHQATVG